MTSLPTIYAVDASGNYLGGFAGCVVVDSAPQTQSFQIQVDSGLIDGDGNPIMRTETQQRTIYVNQDRTIPPSLPAGAVVIDAPPKHGAGVLRSGTWDYSAVPDDVRQALGI